MSVTWRVFNTTVSPALFPLIPSPTYQKKNQLKSSESYPEKAQVFRPLEFSEQNS